MEKKEKSSDLTVGQTIKRLREQKNLSQLELASLADTSPSHICNIETGKSSPGISILGRIADALETPLFVIVDEAEFNQVLSVLGNLKDGAAELRRAVDQLGRQEGTASGASKLLTYILAQMTSIENTEKMIKGRKK